MREKQIEEKHELSTSIYMSGYGLLRKDCDDIAEQLYEEGYRKQSEGEWKWISDDDCICSACGKVFYTADNADAGTGLWNFCPKCGAKMKGENK